MCRACCEGQGSLLPLLLGEPCVPRAVCVSLPHESQQRSFVRDLEGRKVRGQLFWLVVQHRSCRQTVMGTGAGEGGWGSVRQWWA